MEVRKGVLIMKQNCIFCNIANGSIPAAVLFENSEFKVILDANPAAKGHTLIIPKEHIDNIYDMDGDTAGKLFALATVIAKALNRVLDCDGLNILQNNGAASGQTVFHFHMHLIPRWNDDDLQIGWKNQRFPEDELKSLAEEIAQEI